MAGYNDPNFWLALGRLASGGTVGEQLGNASQGMSDYRAQKTAKEEADRLKQDAAAKQQKMLDYARGLDPNMAGAVDAGVLNPQDAYSQYQTNQRNQQEQQRAVAQQNQTLAYLKQVAPEYAAAVESGAISGPDAFKQYQANRSKKPNLMTVGKRLYDADKGQWVDMPALPAGSEEGTEYGVSPSLVQDNDGKWSVLRLGKDGTQKLEALPDGVNPMPGTSNIDLGTSIVVADKKTGLPVRTFQKDNSGEAMQKEQGKSTAESRAQLASARQMAKEVDANVSAIKFDPDLDKVLGPLDSRTFNWREGSTRVQARIDQLKGASFLQARQMLKGGGAITDFEGQKAEAAMARMQQAQSPADFKAALDSFNNAVQDGVRKLEAASNGDWNYDGSTPQGGASQADSVVDDLLNKYGG